MAPPVDVEVKGLSEPLRLYELRAIAGRYAQRAPADEPDATARASVSLAIRCWVIEGKVDQPREPRRPGAPDRPARAGGPPRRALPPLTNVRLRLAYADPAWESADIYGKVIGAEGGDGAPLTRIHFTSITEADTQAIAALIGVRP